MNKIKKERKPKEGDFDQQELLDIRNLAQHPGWVALAKDVKRQVKMLEHQILNDDTLSESIPVSQRDVLRIMRDIALRFLRRPEQITAVDEGSGALTDAPRLDPYARNITELNEMKRKKQGIL